MIRIRKARKQDLHRVARLISVTLSKVNAKYYPKRIIENLKVEYSTTGLLEKTKTRSIYVAMEKNRIVGTASLAKDGWICAMFVSSKYQNLGVGTMLLRKLETMAKNNGLDILRSHVAINSVEFYKKRGFRVVKKVMFKEAGSVYRVIKKLR